MFSITVLKPPKIKQIAIHEKETKICAMYFFNTHTSDVAVSIKVPSKDGHIKNTRSIIIDN